MKHLILFLCALLGSMAWAEEGKSTYEKHLAQHQEFIASLGLSDEQKEKFQTAMKLHHQKMKVIRVELNQEPDERLERTKKEHKRFNAELREFLNKKQMKMVKKHQKKKMKKLRKKLAEENAESGITRPSTGFGGY